MTNYLSNIVIAARLTKPRWFAISLSYLVYCCSGSSLGCCTFFSLLLGLQPFERVALAPFIQHFEEGHGAFAVTRAAEQLVVLLGLAFGVEISRRAGGEKRRNIVIARGFSDQSGIFIDSGNAV